MKKLQVLLILLISVACVKVVNPPISQSYVYHSKNALGEWPRGSIELFTWDDLSGVTTMLIHPVDLAADPWPDDLYEGWITGSQYYNYADTTLGKFRYYIQLSDIDPVPNWHQYDILEIDTSATIGLWVYERRWRVEVE